MNTHSILRLTTPLFLLAALAGCPPADPADEVTIVISPESVEVGTFRKHQFTATVTGTEETGVTWLVREGDAGGTITEDGVYTAPATPGTYQVIATTKTSPAKRASATVKVVEAPPEVTVAIEPAFTQIHARGTVTFTAEVLGVDHPEIDTTVSWSVQEGDAGGTITADGVYTAPDTQGEYHIVATSNANPARSATARVQVRQIVVQISEAPGQTGPLFVNETRSYQATVTGTDNQAVTWSLQGENSGTVTQEGEFALYTAPAVPGTYTLVATSVVDPESFGTFEIEVVKPEVTVTIEDGAREVNTLETLQLSAVVANATDTSVTWSVKAGGVGGTIDASGLYTAPANHGTDTIVATSVEDPTRSDEVVITVREYILEVDPISATVLTDGTVEFTALVQNATNTGVTFSLDPDADSADGTLSPGSSPDKIVYTAPSTAGTDTLRVTSAHNPSRSVTALITVNEPPPVSVTVSPSSQTILTGATLSLTATVANDPASAGVTWSVVEAGGGTVTATGATTADYTAPSTAGVYHVVATSVTDPSKSDTATITVEEPNYDVSISPVGPITKVVGETEQFTAMVAQVPNNGVTWSVAAGGAGGTIDQNGLYTAPSTVGTGTDTVIATSNDDPSKSAQVQITIISNAVVDVTPATHEMIVGDTLNLTANVTNAVTPTVTWSVNPGEGSLSTTTGNTTVYTAPSTPGTYTVTATSDEDPSKSDSVVITVHGWVTTDLHVHFSADNIGFPTDTGGEVSTWADLSGNGYDLTSPFSSTRPILVNNAVNGRPAVRFDGNNDRILNNTIPITGPTTTIFIVHNADPTNGNVTLIDAPKKPDGMGGTVNHNDRNRIQITTAGPTTCAAQLYTTNFGSPSNQLAPRGVFHSITALFDGPNSRVRTNGNEGTMANKPPAVAGMLGVQLGLKQDLTPNGSGGNFSVAEIAEVLVYNRGLTQTEIEQVEAYLRVKYALPAPNPPSP